MTMLVFSMSSSRPSHGCGTTLGFFIASIVVATDAFQITTNREVKQIPLEPTIPAPYNEGFWHQTLQNKGDVQYTGTVVVGGQPLKAIIDTGSFELVIFGTGCTACGSPPHLFNGNLSNTYEKGSFPQEQNYGSGTTFSNDAHDMVTIGGLEPIRQSFWEVYDAEMPILEEDSFAGILGVGPPGSSVKFAEADRDQAHLEDDEYRKQHDEVPQKIIDAVRHYDDVVEHAKATVSFVETLGVENMSVCFGKESGSIGHFIWNDIAMREHPEFFQSLDVVGDIYWSVALTEVSLGESTIWTSGDEDGSISKRSELGCFENNCSAIIDTGTSLMVAPSAVTNRVYEAVEKWVQAGGNCDDVSKLPDLEFKLNGQAFRLGPESYVGRVSGSMGNDLREFMPQSQPPEAYSLDTSNCQPLIMTMDADSQFGPLWIFGMPFFRKYYTTFSFERSSNGDGDGVHTKAKSMSFSVADETECIPKTSPEKEAAEISNNAHMMNQQHKLTPSAAQLNVHLSDVRVPHLARKLKKQENRAAFVRI